MAPLVWLITGCSSGLGLCLARAALEAGHKVIATSRNPGKTPEVVKEIEGNAGGVWERLDVTDDNLEQRIEEVSKQFGRIDVLVNNAGYAVGGSVEDISIQQIRQQMETNFFGPVRLMKAVIPYMRDQKSGTIVNITSTEGITSVPGISVYGASKFALEGISEGLTGEVAAFGIRTLLIEPGGMRTDFLDSNNVVEVEMSEHYKGGIVEHVLGAVRATGGKQSQDPVLSAKRIVEAVDGSGDGWPEGREKYLRLPLGKEAIARVEGKVESWKSTVDALKPVWNSVDFDS